MDPEGWRLILIGVIGTVIVVLMLGLSVLVTAVVERGKRREREDG